MARRQAIFPEVNFVNGLITETTALRFPENACIETWNCVFDHTGRVTRRPGIELENNGTMMPLVEADIATDVHSQFLWETVGSQEALPFLILQRGKFLYFFKAHDTLEFSPNGYHQVIDLTDYVPVGSTADPATERCSFAEGRGNLLVANRACDSIYIEYDESSDSLSVHQYEILYRDFKGVNDGLSLTERVTANVADLQADNPEHYYNLLNQGWHLSDALAQWDTARTDIPSNADAVGFYRASATDVFDPARVDEVFSSVANTPAPKGHFILNAGSPSRTTAMLDEGFTGATVVESSLSIIELDAATTISGGTILRPSALFDGTTGQAADVGTAMNNNSYLGKTLPASTTLKRIVLFTSSTGIFSTGDIEVYAKTGSAPASATDGTLLGTLTFTIASFPSSGSNGESKVLIVTDPTEYDHVWIRNITGSSATLSELFVMTGAPEYNRPSLVAFYAGRAVYAGLVNEGNMNSIYFSQIIERSEQYGLCYQKNDPTDENFFDLLSDDGGVLTIPDIGVVRALFSFQNALIVFASNGVWTVSGSARGPFKADDYEVRKISDVSTLSSSSVCSRRGPPIWWAEDAIFTVQYDPQNDTLSVTSITDERIATFIQAIPSENRRYIKGVYDARSDILYWLYRSTAVATEADRYKYDRVLAMNGITGAFYPWSFDADESDLEIRGFVYTRTPSGLTTPVIKFIVDDPVEEEFSFAEVKNVTTWLDWEDIDYSSYFITGYKIRGETMKFGQIGYFMPFMETIENSSLKVQAIFDFSTSPSTGKWSTVQQCYLDGPFQNSVRVRRLKIPGKGRSVQFKMFSETGKPFSIIGWATEESISDAN